MYNKEILTQRLSAYAESARAKGVWIPESIEQVFEKLLNKRKKIQTFFINEECKRLGLSEPTFAKCLEVLSDAGFIRKVSKPRAGTTITIKEPVDKTITPIAAEPKAPQDDE